jgi:hypothetical protein
VHAAIERGYLDRNEWEFYFVGRCLEEVQLPYGIRPHLVSNLGWSEYPALLRTVDIGLSLMNTPHRSYPPLDLAACGAVVGVQYD